MSINPDKLVKGPLNHILAAAKEMKDNHPDIPLNETLAELWRRRIATPQGLQDFWILEDEGSEQNTRSKLLAQLPIEYLNAAVDATVNNKKWPISDGFDERTKYAMVSSLFLHVGTLHVIDVSDKTISHDEAFATGFKNKALSLIDPALETLEVDAAARLLTASFDICPTIDHASYADKIIPFLEVEENADAMANVFEVVSIIGEMTDQDDLAERAGIIASVLDQKKSNDAHDREMQIIHASLTEEEVPHICLMIASSSLAKGLNKEPEGSPMRTKYEQNTLLLIQKLFKLGILESAQNLINASLENTAPGSDFYTQVAVHAKRLGPIITQGIQYQQQQQLGELNKAMIKTMETVLSPPEVSF